MLFAQNLFLPPANVCAWINTEKVVAFSRVEESTASIKGVVARILLSKLSSPNKQTTNVKMNLQEYETKTFLQVGGFFALSNVQSLLRVIFHDQA